MVFRSFCSAGTDPSPPDLPFITCQDGTHRWAKTTRRFPVEFGVVSRRRNDSEVYLGPSYVGRAVRFMRYGATTRLKPFQSVTIPSAPRSLADNDLSTLPDGIFLPLTGLEDL